jgi:hypothetical protein
MEFDECVAIIDAFKSGYPNVLIRKNAHGIQVIVENGEPLVELLVTAQVEESQLKADEVMPNTLTYSKNGLEQEISTRVVERQIPSAQGQMGRPAIGTGATPGEFGTLGWNFILNNQMTCMSNWHVFCQNGNQTPIGTGITISNTGSIWDGTVQANLSAFQPISPNGANFWDYALGIYVNQADFMTQFRPCADGKTPPYPLNGLSKDVKIGTDTSYRKVGARDAVCRTGRLVAVGDRTVNYDGTLFKFQQQLVFSDMSSPGDSGSIVVRTSDNTATGLLFAGDDTESLANPIYRLPWSYQGFFTYPNGSQVANFVGDPLPKPPISKNTLQSTVLESDISMGFPESLRLEQQFTAGRLYLGIAVKEIVAIQGQPRTERWRTPPPPAIRNVPVETVMFQQLPNIGQFPDGSSGNIGFILNYLCFG